MKMTPPRLGPMKYGHSGRPAGERCPWPTCDVSDRGRSAIAAFSLFPVYVWSR